MKYIVEFSYQYEDLFDTNQFSVETDLSHEEVKQLIVEKSVQIEDIKSGTTKQEKLGNVIYLTPVVKENTPYIDTKGNISQQFRNLATIQFDLGRIIIPLGLLEETIVVMTLDEWFDYCLLGR